MNDSAERQSYGQRLEDVAVRTIAFSHALSKSLQGRHIAGQVLRSGTSAGANYCEAKCAESRADFAHKMQIVVKELRETQYWMRVATRANLVRARQLDGLYKEMDELIAIGVRSIVTSKRGKKTNG